jgi:hypothetical protein
MRQFLDIKKGYPDAILMFRMGDFYEMFFEDATTVGPVLDIAVTSRDKGVECPVPMAGVPYHAIGGYLRTLVERGFKVAICEQMETPGAGQAAQGPEDRAPRGGPGGHAGGAGRRGAPAQRGAQLSGRGGRRGRRGRRAGVRGRRARRQLRRVRGAALRRRRRTARRALAPGPARDPERTSPAAVAARGAGARVSAARGPRPGAPGAALVARVHHLREESGGEALRSSRPWRPRWPSATRRRPSPGTPC